MAAPVPLPVLRCACGRILPAHVNTCPACGGTELQREELIGRSALYAFTTIRVAPPAFAGEAPYHLALVEFPEGLRVIGRLEASDLDSLAIGTPMEVARIDARGPVFRPQS